MGWPEYRGGLIILEGVHCTFGAQLVHCLIEADLTIQVCSMAGLVRFHCTLNKAGLGLERQRRGLGFRSHNSTNLRMKQFTCSDNTLEGVAVRRVLQCRSKVLQFLRIVANSCGHEVSWRGKTIYRSRHLSCMDAHTNHFSFTNAMI